MGREERVSAVAVAVAVMVTVGEVGGGCGGHLVVYWGKREGSKAAGLA